MRLLAPLLFASALGGQTLTFSPQPAPKRFPYTIWGVSACSAPGGSVTFGVLYQQMAARKLKPLLYPAAFQAFHARQTKSIPARIATWAGYAAVGASFLLTTSIVKTNIQIQDGVNIAAGFLNTLIPLASQAVPPPMEAEQMLVKEALRIPPNDCAQGVMLGVAGDEFTAEVGK